jgi:CubicO group peptidase (beta-lactamase class C family)
VSTLDVARRLETYAATVVADALVPGLTVALADATGGAWCAGYGTADAATGERVGVATVFEAASLSKPVVAYGVLLLAQEHVLDLDRPLDSYLPAPYLPSEPGARTISARMALGHTTGFPNWRPRGGPLALLRGPGTRFGYSGEGYVYLQRVVEQLTGQPLDGFLGERVLGPLAMADSTFVWTTGMEQRAARGHNAAGAPVPKDKPGRANAAWSLHTTAPDFVRFVGALLGAAEAGPLSGPGVEEMLRPHTPLHGPLAWGLGWGLHQESGGETLFWHWGDNAGYKAFAAGSRSRGVGVVVLTNGNAGLAVAERLVLEALPPLRAPFDALRDFGPYLS